MTGLMPFFALLIFLEDALATFTRGLPAYTRARAVASAQAWPRLTAQQQAAAGVGSCALTD